MKKVYIISGVVVLIAAAVVLFFVFRKNLKDKIIIPYIAHQKPRIDPHVPGTAPIADKLDEMLFDGLFNVSANPSGVTYEDGLGELIGISEDNVVSIRLKSRNRWHSCYQVAMEKDKITLSEKELVYFTAKDLKFTLRRIQTLGSVSPDYVLVGQAVSNFDFSGPDENDEIHFQFGGDRIWTEPDIKEVLSFKIIPAGSELNAASYTDGTGPYMRAGEYESELYYIKNPVVDVFINNVLLKPFIDNSTYTTELRSRNINVLLSTPFGSVSPILHDSTDFFYKSSIATCFFALLYNVERLDLDQRTSLRALIDNKKIMSRFFKLSTMQQRHIANFEGPGNNHEDYLNYSMFPSTTYYVEEQVVYPLKDSGEPDLSVLPDTVRIKTCLDHGYREELADLVAIINDPALFKGKIKVSSVPNSEIRKGDYDAVLVPVSGYRSNFLFDLYDILLREPDFSVKKINLITRENSKGEKEIEESSFTADKNFFRLDCQKNIAEEENIKKLLEYVYGFMSTREIGDKQAYAQYIDELDQDMVLGSWLFSLPSLAYFSTQFNEETIDLYGIASQLSTIEKWQEVVKK
jgi:hypothetical protein